MQKRILPLAITSIAIISLIGWNCTKLDTTSIGSDIIPAVDNVNTFADTLLINSTQESFYSDSTYLNKFEDHAVGFISNDPLFGQTRASIYMQLKPSFFPYFFGRSGDTLGLPGTGVDSVVLCLKYKSFWGDSTIPVNLEVREIVDNWFRDSTYKENSTSYQATYGAVLGSASVDIRTLGNYTKYTNGRDSVNNQVRIKITNAAWITQLFGRDSIKLNSGNNAFYNDSLYRRFYNGIAVIGGASGGSDNALIYVNIADTSTKLEVHYRTKHAGKIDSVYSSFKLNPSTVPSSSNPASSTGNYIARSRAGYPVSNPPPGEHYLQTAPGTYVNLTIPALATLSNRVIHRAELIIEQIPTDPILDAKLTPPAFLFLDLRDTGVAPRWKPIYVDLNPAVTYDPDFMLSYFLPINQNSGGIGVDYNYYGGFRRSYGDGRHYYNFNISRYVQQIVTRHTTSYGLRLYAPTYIKYFQYSTARISYGNNIANGRVRIGSGSHPNVNYRMKLRIVYSKI